MRGTWSLEVLRGGTANFTADLNMETSDYGIFERDGGGSHQSRDSGRAYTPHHHRKRVRLPRHKRLPGLQSVYNGTGYRDYRDSHDVGEWRPRLV